ncbi:MAG: septum formation initiator family protein [Chloroflexota bacterium]|nr:septum formation initiator family protein [Chloroflexota bacterium]
MKKILTDKHIIVVVVAAILVVLLMNFNQRMVLLSRLRSQEKTLTLEYANLEATRSVLQTKVAGADSDKAVEKWAREEAGMIQDSDVPIVLLPPSVSVTATPTQPAVMVDEVENWEIWQELFFGN